MAEQQLPPWGDDPLSSFFKDAEYNDRASSLNLPAIYALLQRVHCAFRCVNAAVEKDHREALLVPRVLIVRTHSSFLAAIRLAMSGQLSESYAILRVAIEQAWYALHIAKDPQAPNRSTMWLCRHDDDASKAKCKSEFSVQRVRSTHEALDPITADLLHQLYETTIDFGAHPNQRGLLSSMRRAETQTDTTYQVGILHPEPVARSLSLKTCVEVAVGVLKVFQLVFPERFRIMSLDTEIEGIIQDLKRVIESYARTGRP